MGLQAQELDRWPVGVAGEEERELGSGKGEMNEVVSCWMLGVASTDPCIFLHFELIALGFVGVSW